MLFIGLNIDIFLKKVYIICIYVEQDMINYGSRQREILDLVKENSCDNLLLLVSNILKKMSADTVISKLLKFNLRNKVVPRLKRPLFKGVFLFRRKR